MLATNPHLVLSSALKRNRFVDRVYRLRRSGILLASLTIGAVLYQNHAAPLFWAVLAIHALIWPYLARRLAVASADPTRGELRNLMCDSIVGGFWIAAMEFNLLVSALLVSMMSMDKVSVGGWRLLVRALAFQAAGCAVTAGALFVFYGTVPFRPEATLLDIVATLPFMVAYPLMISSTIYELAMKVRRQNRELERLATVDTATGLLNRVSWERAVTRELHSLQRHGHSAALLMIDIDYFKEINDRFGHPTGDTVIATVAAAIRESIRDIDAAGRYGGDEFGVVLTHTGQHAAMVAAERIRARVAAALEDSAPRLRCTLSIGIAAASPGMISPLDWIERADAALYRAKTMGRDQAQRSTGEFRSVVPPAEQARP